VVAFSAFSGLSALLALSVEEGLRIGVGLGDVADCAGSGFGVEVPGVVAGCEFILLSDLMASFVENIRVRRFVIEGFSDVAGLDFCGSEGGAACPLALRFSVLGTAMPFCPIDGRDSGEPMTDDVCEGAGEGWAFSATKESLGVLTVAMMLRDPEVCCAARQRVCGMIEGSRQGGGGQCPFSFRNRGYKIAGRNLKPSMCVMPMLF
jgi:hypothetical protein